jgi:hypothetical protein
MWKYLAALLVVLLSMGGLAAADDTTNYVGFLVGAGSDATSLATGIQEQTSPCPTFSTAYESDVFNIKSTAGTDGLVKTTNDQGTKNIGYPSEFALSTVENNAGLYATTIVGSKQAEDNVKFGYESGGAILDTLAGRNAKTDLDLASILNGCSGSQYQFDNTKTVGFKTANADIDHTLTANTKFGDSQDVNANDVVLAICKNANLDIMTKEKINSGMFGSNSQGNTQTGSVKSVFDDANLNDKTIQDINKHW